MPVTISVEEAQAGLKDLIGRLASGQEIVITQDQRPVARLIRSDAPLRRARRPGNCADLITVASEDDDHLADFAEYMG